MKWVALVARVIVGLSFVVFGLEYFLHFLSVPTPEFPPLAMGYITALGESKYMHVVKVLEIVRGATGALGPDEAARAGARHPGGGEHRPVRPVPGRQAGPRRHP